MIYRFHGIWPMNDCNFDSNSLDSSSMRVRNTLEAATGWIELGLPDEALIELDSVPPASRSSVEVLEVTLAAQMGCQQWNFASETARLLCVKAGREPDFYLQAAYCLHETGDTLAARDWLLRGPKELIEMPIFHYNIACYHWDLGNGNQARTHLKRAISMDETYEEIARRNRDLEGIGALKS